MSSNVLEATTVGAGAKVNIDLSKVEVIQADRHGSLLFLNGGHVVEVEFPEYPELVEQWQAAVRHRSI